MVTVQIVEVTDCGALESGAVFVRDRRGLFVKGFIGSVAYRDVFVTVSFPGCKRGMHILGSDSTKVVTVVQGTIRDVVCRLVSDSLVEVSVRRVDAGQSVIVPPWYAHGYQVTGKTQAVIQYSCTEVYRKEVDLGFNLLSPEIKEFWLPQPNETISERDLALPVLQEFIASWKS